MALKPPRGKVNLFLNMNNTITDQRGRIYSVEEAKELWGEMPSRIDDYNLALGRLVQLDWDLEALRRYYREEAAVRGGRQ